METVHHIVCTHCDAVNRIPAARLADAPQCGSCRAELLDGIPADLAAAQFRKHIARNDLPVVVDFWAAWCGPCRAMAPEFARAAGELRARARLVKLDTENAQDIAAEFAIRSIPTLVLFRNGREVARRSGAQRAADIVHWVDLQSGGARPSAARAG